METKSFSFELRSIDGDTGVIEGMASSYDRRDRKSSTMAVSAFAASLQEHRARNTSPAMLLHHDINKPVGRWDDFNETSLGLEVRGTLASNTRDGADALGLVKSGALQGLSVGFIPLKQTRDKAGYSVFTDVDLIEISLVSVPANPDARIISVRAFDAPRDVEDVFRQCGLSKRSAKAAAGAAWRTISDAPDEYEAERRILSILQKSAAVLAAKYEV